MLFLCGLRGLCGELLCRELLFALARIYEFSNENEYALKLYDKIKSKIVLGKDVRQVLTYVGARVVGEALSTSTRPNVPPRCSGRTPGSVGTEAGCSPASSTTAGTVLLTLVTLRPV